MKKYFSIVCVVAVVICLLLTISGCRNDVHKHSLIYYNAVKATCTQKGNIEYWECTECNQKFTNAEASIQVSDVVIPENHTGETEIRNQKSPTDIEDGYTGDTYCLGCGKKIADGHTIEKLDHTHKTERVKRVEATCTKNGNIEYWKCTECDKMFSDSGATNKVSDVTIPAAHTGGTEVRNEKAPTETQKGYTGDTYCLGCGKKTETGKEIAKLDHVHQMAKTSRKEPTCTAAGNIEYYTCSKCNKTYSDSKGVREVTVNGAVIPPTHKLTHHAPVAATCTQNGTAEYWSCSVCKLNFSDANGKNKITNLVINAIKHNYGDPTWTWNGYTSATAKFVCKNNSAHVETVNASITSKVTSEATTSADGNRRYTATVSFGGKSYTATKDEVIPMLTENSGYDFTYENSTGGVTITGYKGNRIDVVIPVRIGARNVVAIGPGAFENCSAITSIIIPEKVKSIGSYAFSGCASLTKIEIPNNVTSIDSGTFYRCASLTNIEIPDTVTDIGSFAFVGCAELTSIEIPKSMTKIASYAFSGWNGLTNIEIPNTVTAIGKHAFSECISLTSIEIPGSIKTIDYGTFHGCTSLASVTIQDGVQYIYSDPTQKSPFEGCVSLKSVKLPNTLTYISENLFEGCTSLTDIEIPSSVKQIYEYAFSGCTALTSIEIPNTVKEIRVGAFKDCSSLKSISLPFLGNASGGGDSDSNRLSYIFTDEGTYHIPKSLTHVTLTDIEYVGGYAFRNCTYIESITFSSSVVHINEPAFYGCTNLAYLTVEPGNSKYHSSGNCIIETATKKLVAGAKNSVIPSDGSVTSIGTYAFYYRSFETIEIPNCITSIGRGAFWHCNKLTTIKIPSSVTSIDEIAFSECYNLVSVIFEDTSTWYVTSNKSNWENKTGGTLIDVTNASNNETYFTHTYEEYYYWYKL